uniref:Uncharacterized protein n=1 Tax=Arundo donax TaxID=35708 RepID=A0A0A9G866_ARUDO
MLKFAGAVKCRAKMQFLDDTRSEGSRELDQPTCKVRDAICTISFTEASYPPNIIAYQRYNTKHFAPRSQQ